jgi:hypothetical protein
MDVLERHAALLELLFPGVKGIVSESGSIDSHFYVCQKLELSQAASDSQGRPDRTHIIEPFSARAGAPENVIAFYPGKFTAAPIAARDCAGRVTALLNGLTAGQGQDRAPVPQIATQKYYDSATHLLYLADGHLEFIGKPRPALQ